ncbi:hypothetical protein J2W56_001014 [Nocardia kruczakiae]|uniref:Uncharacterized protein n=1 Tax=Nocardia kruczakiae TaxID=261477 RepID=A0ABU1X9S6_9NOCA|nr:hypothetical protein [Nocardia kruczakiae]MDR7167296.1 hypothetical protein [Nocardia kruczakiae]
MIEKPPISGCTGSSEAGFSSVEPRGMGQARGVGVAREIASAICRFGENHLVDQIGIQSGPAQRLAHDERGELLDGRIAQCAFAGGGDRVRAVLTMTASLGRV